MDFKILFAAANDVVQAIDNQPPSYTSADVLASIRNQMIFIRDNAVLNKNPSSELPPNTKFTFAILASRELASPDELLLQAKIDKVTHILINA